MEIPELKKYILEAREYGLKEEEIRRELINAGWQELDINHALEVKTQIIDKELPKIKKIVDVEIAPTKTLSNKKTPQSNISVLPLIFVSMLGILVISFSIYSNKLFSIEIENATNKVASVNIAYNNLLENRNNTSEEISMLFVGDVMLSESRGTGVKMKEMGDYRYPFLRIADVLNSADITFGNLEGPISSRGKNIGSIYSFRANPKAISGLLYAGFDVLSIANNHIFDWGEEAFLDTLSILDANDITAVGGGYNLAHANTPIIKEIRGTKIAFIAFSAVDYESRFFEADIDKPGKTPYSITELTTIIKKIKRGRSADIIVVSVHWGEEYKTRSNEKQQNMAYKIINDGGDIVIGHHPHVAQEVEKYKDGWIAYSLGNFVFDQDFSSETMNGLMLEVKIKEKNISSVNTIPIKISEAFQPYIKSI